MRLSKIADAILSRFPARVIETDGDPYLVRWYVCGRTPEHFHRVAPRLAWLPVTVFVHCFLRSDQGRDLHNHPWTTSVSLILKGGYVEERLIRPRVIRCRRFSPGSVNVIRRNDFHRVDLLADRCWTIFIAGRKVSSWGFLDRERGEWVHWREYLSPERRRARAVR